MELTEGEPGASDRIEPPFVSGECAGCGVLLDDAGIIMAEPEDPVVRAACGPWAQESCGECTLPLSYWRLAPPVEPGP